MLIIIVYYATRFINGTLDTRFKLGTSEAKRVFNKQVSREVYKRVEYYTFSTTKLTNGTHKRNKQLFY
jgi:hypothetical protein